MKDRRKFAGSVAWFLGRSESVRGESHLFSPGSRGGTVHETKTDPAIENGFRFSFTK
jgi:hypothetical protein